MNPYPLGKPTNRAPPEKVWHPIERRPGWFRNRDTGEEVYTEPLKPPTAIPPWPFPLAKVANSFD